MVLIGYWRPHKELTKPYDPSSMIRNGVVVDEDFWRNPDDDKYPWPSDLIAPDFWKDTEEKQKVIGYLQSGSPCNHYHGISSCRLCGDTLSSYERNDGIYLWPDMLEHYLEKHSISLPDRFLNHIRSNSYKIFIEIKDTDNVKHDETFWIESQGK